jgi:hypothetical protein
VSGGKSDLAAEKIGRCSAPGVASRGGAKPATRAGKAREVSCDQAAVHYMIGARRSHPKQYL